MQGFSILGEMSPAVLNSVAVGGQGLFLRRLCQDAPSLQILAVAGSLRRRTDCAGSQLTFQRQ